MALSQLQLINAALVKLGAYKIATLADESTESDIAGTLYAPVRDTLLSAYPWSFAVCQAALSTPASPAPLADYQYAFTLPSDCLRILSVGENGAGQGAAYRLKGGRIETNAAQIILTYIARGDEAAQPPYFDSALIARLAAELCLPLTENATRAETLYRLAESEMARARHIDAVQDTPVALSRFSLIDVRG